MTHMEGMGRPIDAASPGCHEYLSWGHIGVVLMASTAAGYCGETEMREGWRGARSIVAWESVWARASTAYG